jgi:hypothetical protein
MHKNVQKSGACGRRRLADLDRRRDRVHLAGDRKRRANAWHLARSRSLAGVVAIRIRELVRCFIRNVATTRVATKASKPGTISATPHPEIANARSMITKTGSVPKIS